MTYENEVFGTRNPPGGFLTPVPAIALAALAGSCGGGGTGGDDVLTDGIDAGDGTDAPGDGMEDVDLRDDAGGDGDVEAALEGYATARADVLVAPLEAVRVPLSLEPAAAGTPPAEVTPDLSAGDREPGAGLPSAWFWATAGTAAAMGIGGAVAGGITLDKEGDLDALAGRCRGGEQAACDEGLAMLGDRDDARLAASVLLFGGGAFAATALVLAFFTDFDFGDEAPPVQVTAGPAGLDASGSPSGAALGVSVAF